MAERNYYILLEVKNTATFEEIKSSYRILAKKYHPDKNIGNKAAEEYFKEIQQAYTVLSNPEKRKKYDLKFSYSTQQRSYSSGPQYNGNAYQYAQQQAQARQQPFSTQKKQQPIKEHTESWQIIVSVGIALVLLYFIISYSTEKTTASTKVNQAVSEKIVEKTIEPQEALINNFDSPYSSFFGDEISDSDSKNSITIFNSNSSEAVVCLIEKDAPNRTIRNQYMNRNTEFKMNEVPDGTYFLKVYFGKDWNPDKTFLNNTIKGGFDTEKGFIELNSGTESLIMKKEKTGSSFSYSTYEIKINADDNQHSKSISPENFFKK